MAKMRDETIMAVVLVVALVVFSIWVLLWCFAAYDV